MRYEFSSAIALRDAITSKKLSAVDVVRNALQRQVDCESHLNCFATRTPELALEAAYRADQAIQTGQPPGALHGLPISVKDLIAIGGVRQMFGSRSMEFNVAQTDAPAVARIKAAGACIIGTTTTSEFGCKAVGDSPLTGITRNPWNTDKTPGGSSCGAAASVAAGVTPFALGTDGGGSIRAPSSLTGLFGIKAQFARVPVFPASATPTLGHVGPLARTVRDAALLLSVIAGHDPRDPFSVAGKVPDFQKACDLPIKGMRLAWSPTLGYAKPDPEVVRITELAVKRFESLGCEIIDLSEGIGGDPVACWMAEFYAGVGTRLNETLRTKRHLLDPAVASMLDKALDLSLLDYYSQVFVRYQFREKIRTLFNSFDLLLTPTLPVSAFDVGLDIPPQFSDRNVCSWQYYTYPFNLTGQPAASLPVGFTNDELPVGLQLVAAINQEVDIFRAAAAFEAAFPWDGIRPPLLDRHRP
ncbi:MAG: amidase [Herminiimonas sp.]|nr:amidase [Herminiimonas sp.]